MKELRGTKTIFSHACRSKLPEILSAPYGFVSKLGTLVFSSVPCKTTKKQGTNFLYPGPYQVTLLSQRVPQCGATCPSRRSCTCHTKKHVHPAWTSKTSLAPTPHIRTKAAHVKRSDSIRSLQTNNLLTDFLAQRRNHDEASQKKGKT